MGLITRRSVLTSSAFAFGLSISGCGKETSKRQPLEATSAIARFEPSLALSLRALATALKKGGAASKHFLNLGGLNRIVGLSSEEDGDVLVLGHKLPSWPEIHVDDLAVTLRGAFRVGSEYQQAPGVSIDPIEGADDPWTMQKVRVFGMPFSCALAARQVEVDYQLKQASLGLITLKPGIPSLADFNNDLKKICSSEAKGEQATQKAHRFWFCPLIPDEQRFVRDGRAIWVQRPTGVRVLTEEEFLDKNAKRTGARKAEGAAVDFVAAISKLLAEGALPQYVALRTDFRLIELAKLIALSVNKEHLAYFLSEYQIGEAKVPVYVGGLSREDSLSVSCENTITEERSNDGIRYKSHSQIKRASQHVRGGVEASVPVSSADIKESPLGIQPVVVAARKSRPGKDAVVWQVKL